MLSFVRTHKKIIFLGLFCLVIPLILLFFRSKGDNTLPPILPYETKPLSIISTNPVNGTKSVTIFQPVSLTFSRSLLEKEQKIVQINLTPDTPGTVSFLPDGKTFVFTPSSPYKVSQQYNVNVIYPNGKTEFSFTTIALDAVSTSDQEKAQNEADNNFRKRSVEIKQQYPWLTQLPLQTSNYFVYFDIDTKQFTAFLYTKGTQISEEQKSAFKTTIQTRLQQLGADLTKYPLIFEEQ